MSEDIVANEAAAAMSRLQQILTDMHPQAAEIVTGQVAIERELRQILKSRFANPDRLPNLKAAHVLALLEATTIDAWTLLVLDAAAAFTNVRNAIAHAENAPGLKRAINRLFDAMEHIASRPDPDTVKFGSVALGIVAALHLAFGEGGTLAS